MTARTAAAAASVALALTLVACTNFYEVPIETPIQPKMDVSPFQRVLIAGFLAGAGEVPLLKYQDGVFARFTDYLRLRQHLYGLEQRWPHASFWQNRLR